MLHLFHTLSNVQIGLSLLGFGLTISTIAPLLLRYYFKWAPGESFAKGAEESFKVMISLTLLLLAFSLVRTQGDHRSVEDLVAREAAVVLKLDRAYAGFGSEKGGQLRAKLMQYSTLVVGEEWPLLEKGGRSDGATDLLMAMSVASKSLEPASAPQQIARAEILSAFTQLMDLREARLAASRVELPTYFWQAIVCSITMLIVLGWFQSPLSKMAPYLFGVTCALSLLLTVLISTAGIFIGENAVTAQALQRVIVELGKKMPADGVASGSVEQESASQQPAAIVATTVLQH